MTIVVLQRPHCMPSIVDWCMKIKLFYWKNPILKLSLYWRVHCSDLDMHFVENLL